MVVSQIHFFNNSINQSISCFSLNTGIIIIYRFSKGVLGFCRFTGLGPLQWVLMASFDLKTIVKDKRFWAASFLIAWAAGLQVIHSLSFFFQFTNRSISIVWFWKLISWIETLCNWISGAHDVAAEARFI